jgi:hypothetical protein
MTIPTIRDGMTEARKSLLMATPMLQYLCEERDLEGATIAYVACQQIAYLLSMDPEGSGPVTIDLKPHNDEAKAFFKSVMVRARLVGGHPTPAIQRLEKYWRENYGRSRLPLTGEPGKIELGDEKTTPRLTPRECGTVRHKKGRRPLRRRDK